MNHDQGLEDVKHMVAHVKYKAVYFIHTQAIDMLPVNPYLLSLQNGWKIITYDDLAEITHKSVKWLIDRSNNKGFVIWSNRHNSFLICHNPNLPASARRWILLHEMAHIVLEHVTPENPIMTYAQMAPGSQWEREAQEFTYRVLCPLAVLHSCHISDMNEIMQVCGIDEIQARCVSEQLRMLESLQIVGEDPTESEIESQFSNFIQRYRLKKIRELQITYNAEATKAFSA